MTKRINLRARRTTLMTLMVAAWAAPAWAGEFEFGDGWTGNWSSSVSLGSSWRAADRDSRLYGQGNGALLGLTDGTGANTLDEGNLNYAKKDRFTTQLKLFGEDICPVDSA